jgi:hypothetical protein
MKVQFKIVFDGQIWRLLRTWCSTVAGYSVAISSLVEQDFLSRFDAQSYAINIFGARRLDIMQCF